MCSEGIWLGTHIDYLVICFLCMLYVYVSVCGGGGGDKHKLM